MVAEDFHVPQLDSDRQLFTLRVVEGEPVNTGQVVRFFDCADHVGVEIVGRLGRERCAETFSVVAWCDRDVHVPAYGPELADSVRSQVSHEPQLFRQGQLRVSGNLPALGHEPFDQVAQERDQDRLGGGLVVKRDRLLDGCLEPAHRPLGAVTVRLPQLGVSDREHCGQAVKVGARRECRRVFAANDLDQLVHVRRLVGTLPHADAVR